MNRNRSRQQPLSTDTLLNAWCTGLAESLNAPGLTDQPGIPDNALYARFTGQYQRLASMPRRTRRALQRQYKRTLAGIAMLMALAAMGNGTALANTITVDASCTLVDAITAANSDTATGGCPAGSGSDTIVLPTGSTQTLTAVNNDTYEPTGLPVISGGLTIQGNGSRIVRDSAAPPFRILAVSPSAFVFLEDTTISGGSGTFGGGGIFNQNRLFLINCTVSGNSANVGGGVLNQTSFSGLGARVDLINSTVSGNSSPGRFGRGGGIANVNPPGTYGEVTLSHSTVSGNIAAEFGGGLYSFSGSIFMDNSVISGNTSNSTTGREVNRNSLGSIVAFNSLFGHSGITTGQAFADFTPGASNLIATSDGNTPTALGNILDTTLTDNGGPTPTHALVERSPAIDAINDGACPPPDTDQRGVARPQDGNGDGGPACDIGAYEVNGDAAPAPEADLMVTKTDSSDPVAVGEDLTYTVTVTNNGPGDASDVTLSDTLPTGVSFVSASAGCSEAGGTVTCTLGDLLVSANTPVEIVVIPTAGGEITNTASVSADTSDPEAANNTSSETTTVTPALCLGVEATITGTVGDDDLRGTPGPDVIAGLAGNDILRGFGGDDLLCGDDGDDLLIGNAGNDHLDGGADTDTLRGGAGVDELHGGDGNDELNGGRDGDNLFGEDGDDILNGHSGDDTLEGGDGNDELLGNSGNDTLHGGNDFDLLKGGADDDRLFGGADSDALYGHNGDDTLDGGEAFDFLNGNAGTDTCSNGESVRSCEN